MRRIFAFPLNLDLKVPVLSFVYIFFFKFLKALQSVLVNNKDNSKLNEGYL